MDELRPWFGYELNIYEITDDYVSFDFQNPHSGHATVFTAEKAYFLDNYTAAGAGTSAYGDTPDNTYPLTYVLEFSDYNINLKVYNDTNVDYPWFNVDFQSNGIINQNNNDDIGVNINGEELIFDQPPVIINERTLVPIRTICENMGFDVEWDQSTATAKITNGKTTVHIPIDSYKVYMGEEKEVEHDIDVPAQVINGRTLVPVRVLTELFGAIVNWDGDNRNVLISYEEPEALYLVEGSPVQYGTTHALLSDTAVKVIKVRYGVDAERVMSGNTLEWYEGGGYTFTVERWYTPENGDLSAYNAVIYVHQGTSGY